MKSQSLFPGFILMGFGLYFFLEQSNIEPFQGFFTWPTLLMIVGIAFLVQAYGARDYEAILPGVTLTGFGIHFHIVTKLKIWPDHIGIFILIIGLGFILRARETKSGMIQGVLLLLIAVLLLFYDRITSWMGLLESSAATAWKFWPFLLIGSGLFFMLQKKRK
ncbi:LiaF transmembrane domain-containing protein [Peribacillus deserti]|uniref:LiaI-LiaF-like transmembrane region domain-containing protein n=1 Tax=Peribacillus deserti TaxID=673318 RepID=A0A2N5M734_9BACI|nr:DUF5668 domain-containing protein [Peribacillus deserti]PLT30184.1 hypothetical protein CUU66_09080 [Peribacillus deserti]